MARLRTASPPVARLAVAMALGPRGFMRTCLMMVAVVAYGVHAHANANANANANAHANANANTNVGAAPAAKETLTPADLVDLGVLPAHAVVAFAPSKQSNELALRAVARHSETRDRAQAIYQTILSLKRSHRIVGDRNNRPKRRYPKTAADVVLLAQGGSTRLARLAANTKVYSPELLSGQTRDRRAGCYELSALYVAMARAVGLDAVGLERAVADGDGQIGHIVAGVRLAADDTAEVEAQDAAAENAANAPGPGESSTTHDDNGAGGLRAPELLIFDLQNETDEFEQPVQVLSDQTFAAHHYNHRAVAAYLRGDTNEALLYIDYALRLAPDGASFRNNRATILAAQGETELALADAVWAVQQAPKTPLYRYQLGRLHLSLGELSQAERALRQAVWLRPRYGLARRDLGWALLLLGHWDMAAKELEAVVRFEPRTPDAHLYLSLFHLATGARDEATAVAERGLKRRPQSQSLRVIKTLADRIPLEQVPKEQHEAYVRLQQVLASARRGGLP